MSEKSKPGSKEYIQNFEESKPPPPQLLKKRPLSELKTQGMDAIVGPDTTKKPKIDFEEVILDNLPKAELYERSLMHRDIINHGKIEGRKI